MRLYRLDALRPPQVPGSARAAAAGDRELAAHWYERFGLDSHTPVKDPVHWVDTTLGGERTLWFWLDAAGAPVSMAAHTAPQRGSARIGPVYTPDDARGCGYGSAITAWVSAQVQARGAVPVLFTDLGNPTSNAIYQRLGYYGVRDYLEIQLS